MNDLRTLTIREAMDATGLSRDCFYRAIRAREITVVRITGRKQGRMRIQESSLRDWIARHTTLAKVRPRPVDPPMPREDHRLPAIEEDALFA